ncbi:MAG TPA: hypothetical protein VMM13_14735 [Euzebya sp.]|nr:hypothetical protein [Euzebya sp.]
MTTEPLLDRQRLLDAFRLLAAKLARRGVVGEVHVFGGAAMVLVFDERAATRDVDAIFEPDGPMLDAAAEVARELELPRSWLNNQASTYVSGRAGRGTPAFDHPNLRVLTTPAEHLLAMKVRAARPARDADDIRLLLDHLGIDAVDDVITVAERYFPDDPLSDRSRMLIEDLLW